MTLFRPAGHFVLRSPLLPLEALEGARGDLQSGREWLRTLLARPEVKEAFVIASPTLMADLEVWITSPTSERGRKLERALMSYAQRICSRATPFGWFAGVGLGHVATHTALALSPHAELRRKTRIDMGALFAFCEKLIEEPSVRMAVRYHPNETLIEISDKLHFVQGEQVEKGRTYHLSSTNADLLLQAVLSSAKTGLTGDALVARVSELESDASPEECRAFVEQLIAEQLVVPELRLMLTGQEAGPDIAAQLRRLPGQAERGRALQACLDELAELDRTPLGTVSNESVMRPKLEALGITAEPGQLLQADLWKPAAATLSPGLVQSVLHTAELLTAVFRRSDSDLGAAISQFTSRYESAEVPLLEALDAEVGLSELAGAGLRRDSPLLRDIAFGDADPDRAASVRAELRDWLDELLVRARGAELVLEEPELTKLATGGAMLAESFAIRASFFAAGARDAPLMVIDNLTGPSSESMNGRFAWLDSELEETVRKALAAEEALRPEALFFDIVHSPQGRVGNVITRPLLRKYELPVLGRSGASAEHQIDLADVLLSVRDDRFVLTSQSRGCELVPRLTNAHNTSLGFSVYRFLARLQSQGAANGPLWSWAAHAEDDFLPRVRVGRIIVSPAQWRLHALELKKLTSVAELRTSALLLRWPRFVRVRELDNTLPIDLESDLSVETFLGTYGKRDKVVIEEDTQRLFGSLATGPSGTYAHEALISYRAAERIVPPLTTPVRAPLTRTFAPGSEWLFMKMYVGQATADRLLAGPLAELVASAREEGKLAGWFFLRYADPEHHLRMRFRGDPAFLTGPLQSRLFALFTALHEERLAHQMTFDTYVREVERYGGAAGMEACEAWFEADSDAVVALLQLQGGLDQRWRWALRGLHDGFAALGLDLESEHAAVQKMRSAYFKEHHGASFTEQSLATKFRPLRAELHTLLTAPAASDAQTILQIRAQRLHALAEPLRVAAQNGTLYGSLETIGGSLGHMHAIRLLRSHAREHELVLYDFLSRTLGSQKARRTRPTQ